MANFFLGPQSANMAGGGGTANLDDTAYYYGVTTLPGTSDTLFVFQLSIDTGGYAYFNNEAGIISVGTLDTWIYGESDSPYPADTSPGPFTLEPASTIDATEWNASSGTILGGASIEVSDTLDLLLGTVVVEGGYLSVGNEIEMFGGTLVIDDGTLSAGYVDEGNYSSIDIENGATANFSATVLVHSTYDEVPPGSGVIIEQSSPVPGFVVKDSQATFQNDVLIGDAPSPPAGINNGWMQITNGATATVTTGYVSVGYAPQGTAELDVIGSVLNITDNDLVVGDEGYGLANIEANGTVETGSSGLIGIGDSSHNSGRPVGVGGGIGTIDIGGAGALMTTPVLLVGLDGYGSLDISNGASVATSSYVSIGGNSGESGTISIGDATFNNTGYLYAGVNGAGALNVTGGGGVTFDGFATIGDFTGSSGSVEVSGAGAIVNVGSAGVGDLVVAAEGAGSLDLSNGGSVNVAGDLLIGGGGAGADATVGQGSVTVDAGSTLTSSEADIANATGGVGESATITGGGALWNDTGEFYLGDGGAGSLGISAGGVLDAVTIDLGNVTTGIGAMTVDGGTVDDTGDLIAGGSGEGSVQLIGGGSISVSGTTYVGFDSGGIGTLSVTGGTYGAGDIFVGSNGTGTLDVLTGGSVDAGSNSVQIGDVSGSTGVVLVSSAGASLTAGSLTVGSANGGTGTLTIATGGTVTAGTAEIAAGGQLTLDGGALVTDPLTVDASGQLVGFGSVAGAVTINGFVEAVGGKLEFTGAIDGGGTAEIAGNSTLALDGATAASTIVDFAGSGATLEVGATAATVTNFFETDAIQIDDFHATAAPTYANGVYQLAGTNSVGATMDYSFAFGSSPTFQQLSESPSGANTVITTTACYVRGTRIATEFGERSIESLRIGERVATASGALRRIRWIGRRAYEGRFARRNPDVIPVLIRAGALAPGVPTRDLAVSPRHAMLIDGLLIPAERLLNGVSIARMKPVPERIEYFHIEFSSHDVILAEGAASESFVDDDSRMLFHNAASFAEMYPNAAKIPAIYCAPRVNDGFVLEAIRQRLGERAGLREPTRIQAPLRGFVDEIRFDTTLGWIVEGWARGDESNAPVCLDILLDGEPVTSVLANRFRADLLEAGVGRGRHGFAARLPGIGAPTGRLAARRLAVRRSADGAALAMSAAFDAAA